MKKRVTIPMNDGLVQSALISALANIESIMNNVNLSDESRDELYHVHFDYLGLIGIFSGDYKVTIEIEEDELNAFSGKHGVDFPPFVELEVVDIKEDEDEEEQFFDHLAYEEDGGLVLAIRSNKPFKHSTCEDDSDMPHYRYERVEEGDNLFMEGYSAVSYFEGWMIIKDGDVLERVLL